MKNFFGPLGLFLMFSVSACNRDEYQELTIVNPNPSSGFLYALRKPDGDVMYPVILSEFVSEPTIGPIICVTYENSEPPFWYPLEGWCGSSGPNRNYPEPPERRFIRITKN